MDSEKLCESMKSASLLLVKELAQRQRKIDACGYDTFEITLSLLQLVKEQCRK
jgi:hypothetical protein